VLSKRSERFGEENSWEVFRGNVPPPAEPAPFTIVRGRERGDVMYTDLLGISFSARLADLLVSIGCTGFSPNPSVIYDLRDREVVCTDAKWTQFQRGSGEPDRERGYDPLRPFHDARRNNFGLFFDHSMWTGLDMFKPVKCPRVVITDRIPQAILGAGLRGYHLVRTEEYGKDMVDVLNNLGRLPGQPPRQAPDSLAALEAAAPYFRLVTRPDPQARPRYDMLSDAVVWLDEGPDLPPNLNAWCLRQLWRCRTCKIIGIPVEHEALWDRAKELFPEWIGFLPERSAASPENVDVYRQGVAALRPKHPE
jgi:hypothetical protein